MMVRESGVVATLYRTSLLDYESKHAHHDYIDCSRTIKGTLDDIPKLYQELHAEGH